MRTYKERLPEIDKAIFELGGEWPHEGRDYLCRAGGLNTVYSYGKLKATEGSASDDDQGYWKIICTRTEFESRLADWRRLYEWRLQKGGIPISLTLREWLNKGLYRDGALKKSEEERFNWQKSLEEDMEESSWYECGEKPPVGEVVEFFLPDGIAMDKAHSGWETGDKLEVITIKETGGKFDANCIVWNIRLKEARNTIIDCLRPLQSERDKLISQCAAILEKGVGDCEPDKYLAEQIVDAGWRPTESENGK